MSQYRTRVAAQSRQAHVTHLHLEPNELHHHYCASSEGSYMYQVSNPKSPKSFNKGDIQGRTLWREKPEKENEKKKRKKMLFL